MTEDIRQTNDIKIAEIERLSIDRLPLNVQQDLRNIFTGKTLPPLYSDIIAKKVFHADIHPDRLNFLLRSIAKDDSIDVDKSAGNESVKQSIHAKGMIYDLPAWLKDKRLADLGFQKAAQEFLFTRMELYASDMLLLQYTVEADQAKGELDYQNVNDVLIIVLMVDSPKAFKEYNSVSDRYIHRFTTMTADTGLTYKTKAKMMYVQLDKCLEQFREGMNAEAAESGKAEDGKPDELQLWLSMIADVNDKSVIKAAEADQELQNIRAEIHGMAQDKEVQNMIIQERYDRMDWLTYGNEQRREGAAIGEARGEIKGAIKLYSEEMNLQPLDIVQKIITRFSLNENEAEQYVMSTLGLQKM